MPGAMPSSRATNRRASGHPQRIARSSQRGHALVVVRQREIRLGQHVDVHQPPALRPELLVKAPAERLDLQPCAALGRKQPSVRGRTSIDPSEYLRRLPDRAFGRDQHGNGEPAPGAPRGEAVDALHVALLSIGHARPLEGPARLLAVVADRDRHQPQHRPRSMAPRAARAASVPAPSGGELAARGPRRTGRPWSARVSSGSGQRHADVLRFDAERAVAGPVVGRIAAQQLELDRVPGREYIAVAVQLERDRSRLAFGQPVHATRDQPLRRFTARRHVPQTSRDLPG